jgi:hypothetical protein
MTRKHGRALTAIALAAALVLCGGCARGGRGKISELFINNQRYVIDDTREIVHIYGRLDNTGRGRFRQVEIEVTLLSKTGGSRGVNNVILQNLQPLEQRLFAVDVTSHGRVSDVVVKIREPNTP